MFTVCNELRVPHTDTDLYNTQALKQIALGRPRILEPMFVYTAGENASRDTSRVKGRTAPRSLIQFSPKLSRSRPPNRLVWTVKR